MAEILIHLFNIHANLHVCYSEAAYFIASALHSFKLEHTQRMIHHSSPFRSTETFVKILENYKNNVNRVGFEVLTAVGTKMAVFWVVAPCSLVEIYQCFRGPCCLHHRPDDGGSKVL
jgi:hypothetical protein